VGFFVRESPSKERSMSGDERRSRFEQSDDVVVMKFGGTSVEDAPAIRRLIGIVQSRGDAQPVLVVSALARVTDELLEAGRAAAKGRLGAALANVRDIYVRHEFIADELTGGARDSFLDGQLRAEFRALEALLHRVETAGHLDPRSQDALLGCGEQLSSRLVAAALREAGTNAIHVDACTCIVTDARHGQASPLWDETNHRIREELVPLLQLRKVPVLGGFIASSSDGVPTTLGRGGSDFSASIVAAALGATRVEIWTDVDGVMTTDPKLCPEARVIRKMSFEEAAELAHYGAKVLHPATIAPAMRENIPVYVLNSRNPKAEGTEIVGRTRSANGVSAITVKRQVAAVEVEPLKVMDSQVLGAIYDTFDQHECPVDVMGTSVGRLSILVGATSALPKVASALRDVANVRWDNHKALVCLVGENLRRQADVASRIFGAVTDLDVRVVSQGASERTLTFLVDESKVEEVVRRLHRMFFPVQREAAPDWGGTSAAFCQAG
jgi:aspartate kinase